MFRFKGLSLVLVFFVSACSQAGLGLTGAGPLGAAKPTSDTTVTDKTDLSDGLDSKPDGNVTDLSKNRILSAPFDASNIGAAGGDGGGSSSTGGSTTTIARIDPLSAQVGSSDIGCPEGADGGDYCIKAKMLRYRSGQYSDDPREKLAEEVRYVRVVEVPADVATNLNLTSADDFLQRVRLGAITDADAKLVTYRDVVVAVQPDGTFATPALKPGLNLIYESPAKVSETPQSFQSTNEIQSTVANVAYLAAFRSSVSDIQKANPSLLMDVRGR